MNNKNDSITVLGEPPVIQETNSSMVPKEQKGGRFKKRRIVDLLDLQLLLAVIVFFVSGWAYLNGIICNFTGSESYSERMGYILVHYILTAVLALCIYITFIKSKYLFPDEKVEVQKYEQTWVDFFVYSWVFILIMCISIILITQNADDFLCEKLKDYAWIGCAFLFLFILSFIMKLKKISGEVILFTNLSLIALFPVFIACMMSITKDVEINFKKTDDLSSKNVYITVNAKGYDCKYILAGPSKKNMTKGVHYDLYGDAVMSVDPICFPDNKIVIGLVSPSVDDSNYMYALRKILLDSPQPLEGKSVEERKKFYKSAIFYFE